MPAKTVYHVVNHTHWDREWYVTFEEFRVQLVHMIDDLLEILKERPGLRRFPDPGFSQYHGTHQ